MQYQIPENIDPQKVFLVRRSELLDRFDAQYYKEHFDFSNFTRLSHYVTIQGGKRIPKGEGYSFDTTPYLYLRVADITEESAVGYSELKCIDEKIFKILEKYEIHENEIAISIAGTIGKVLLVKNVPTDKRIILTENCAKLIVRGDGLIPEYLSIVLRISILQKQMMLNYIQTTIPKIGLDRIGKLMIPNIPSRAKQEGIIAYYNEAVEEQKTKNKESQQLLDSINDYLLEELGITLPDIDSDLSDRIFCIKSSELVDRLDPRFNRYSVFFKNISSSYSFTTLNEVIINKGQYGANESAIDYNVGDVRYIRITDIDELGYLKDTDKKTASTIDSNYLLKSDDILFARSGSVGKCYIHKNLSCPAIFAGYLIRFDLDKNKINPDFLFYYCNSKLYQLWVETIRRPAAQANINAQEFRKMMIPLPPLPKQEEIAKHILEIRQKANSLREEGKQILQQANREVEKMILG